MRWVLLLPLIAMTGVLALAERPEKKDQWEKYYKNEDKLGTPPPTHTTYSTTEPGPVSPEIAFVNAKLRDILRASAGRTKGNWEYEQHLHLVREAIYKGSLYEKVRVLSDFEEYDEKRLSLEYDIDVRIYEIDELLHELGRNNKQCYTFYTNQKQNLEEAYTLPNKEKWTALRKNTGKCFAQADTNDQYWWFG